MILRRGPLPPGPRDQRENREAFSGDPMNILHKLTSASDRNGSAPLFATVYPSEVKRCAAWLESRIRAHATTGMSSEMVLMTPAWAEFILKTCNEPDPDKSYRNRGYRPARGQYWAKTIREGGWKFHSQGISFSRDGKLMNGQHRLNGIILAGTPVNIYVTFGEERDVFSVLDTGAPRTGSDVLSIAGYKNTTHLAAASNILMQVSTPTPFVHASLKGDDLLEFVQQRPQLEDCTTLGLRLSRPFPKSSKAAAVAACYLIKTQSATSHHLDDYIEMVTTGLPLRHRPLTAKSTLKLLFDRMHQNQAIDARLIHSTDRAVYQCALYVITWNSFLRNGRGAPAWDYRALPFPTAE